MFDKKLKKRLVKRQIMIGFIALGITLVKSATFSTEAGPAQGKYQNFRNRRKLFQDCFKLKDISCLKNIYTRMFTNGFVIHANPVNLGGFVC